jgi:signal transduction histidine kinase
MELDWNWWRRLRGVSPLVYDSALAVLLAVAAELEFRFFNPNPAVVPQPDTRTATILLLTLPLALRRRQPIVCAVLQLSGSALIRAQPPYVAIFGILLGVYSLSAYGPSPWLAPAWVLVAVTSLQLFLPGIRMEVAPSVLTLLGGTVAWVGGEAMRQRVARARMLEERAERLRRERDLASAIAVQDERRRIARELHDVVAHSVSLMLVQAGAARMVRGQPERAVEALRQVEASGRQALDDLRHLVGLLGAEADSELAPQPGLDQLEQLAGSLAAAGLPVRLRLTGQRRPLSPGLDLTAYRIVQEALTNSLKHAPGSSAEVHIDFGAGQLTIEVVDSSGRPGGAPIAGGGHGLPGMRERVAVYEGRLEAGPRPEGGWEVRAVLPLEQA